MSVDAWQAASVNSANYFQLQQEMEEAACDVMMSQATLMSFTTRTLKSMRRAVQDAEERGYDVPELCDGRDLEICRHVENVELYQRVVMDIKSLRQPR